MTAKIRPRLEYGVLAVFFAAGLLGYVLKTTHWFTVIPGDYFDARFNSVILEHLFQWVRRRSDLWNPAFFYPFEGVLGWSDNHFGTGIFYGLFRFAGLSRESAFIGWFVVGNVLNYWPSYYVIRRLGYSVIASAAASFVFAFNLTALAQESHAQLVYRFAIPFAVLAQYEFLRTKEVGYLFRTIIFAAIQFFCSIYLGVFLVYLLAAMLLGCLVSDRQVTRGWTSRALFHEHASCSSIWYFAGACFSVVLLAMLLVKYQTIATQYAFKRPTAELLGLLPEPESYLIADRSVLTGWIGKYFANAGYRQEKQLFFGAGVWLVAFVGLWSIWIRRLPCGLGKASSISLILLMAFTLKVNQFSLYEYVMNAPGISSIRAVSRLVLVMLFPLSVLVAAGFDGILTSKSGRVSKNFVVLVMGVAVVIETMYYQPYGLPKTAWTQRQERLREFVKGNFPRDAIVYVTNSLADPWKDLAEVDGMIFAQDRELPTLNGYSGNLPPGGYLEPHPCIDFRSRLINYFRLFPDSSLSMQEIEKRVRVISPQLCPTEPALLSEKIFDPGAIKDLRIELKEVSRERFLTVNVSIVNNSSVQLDSFNLKFPIRMSWAFVPVNASGDAINPPSWDPRKNVLFSIAPGHTHHETLTVELPKAPGRYRFAVSLVQEGKHWFHDLGMETPGIVVDLP